MLPIAQLVLACMALPRLLPLQAPKDLPLPMAPMAQTVLTRLALL